MIMIIHAGSAKGRREWGIIYPSLSIRIETEKVRHRWVGNLSGIGQPRTRGPGLRGDGGFSSVAMCRSGIEEERAPVTYALR